jgi:nucleotide-binding universal stress UspA family protein
MTSQPDEQPALEGLPEEPRNILVAVDASAGAERVLNMGARLARSMQEATIHVLHVFRASRLDRARAGAPPPAMDAMEDAKEHLAYCARMLRRRTRAQIVQHFAVGDPAAEVLRLGTELDIDLLVVGTHDHIGFEKLLLGSVAERLMRKSGCPIVIVRPKNHKS